MQPRTRTDDVCDARASARATLAACTKETVVVEHQAEIQARVDQLTQDLKEKWAALKALGCNDLVHIDMRNGETTVACGGAPPGKPWSSAANPHAHLPDFLAATARAPAVVAEATAAAKLVEECFAEGFTKFNTRSPGRKAALATARGMVKSARSSAAAKQGVARAKYAKMLSRSFGGRSRST
jgi:hypothetical protein